MWGSRCALCLLCLMMVCCDRPSGGRKSRSAPSCLLWVQISDTHIVQKGEDVERENWLKEAITEINRLRPDFVVVTGDLVELPSDEAYQNYVTIMSELDAPLYSVIGNHDDNSAANPADYADLYRKYVDRSTYYSFDWREYHLVVLDSVAPGKHSGTFHVPEDQLDWLKKDLSKAGDKKILMFSHHPPTGERFDVHDYDDLRDIMKDYNVKALYSAHLHGKPLEEFIDNTYFINTGATSSFPLDGSELGYRVNLMSGDWMWSACVKLGESAIQWKQLYPREE